MNNKKEIDWEKQIEENVKAMQPLLADDETCRVVDAWQDVLKCEGIEATPAEALNDLAQYACLKIGEEREEEEEEDELDYVYVSETTKSIVEEWRKRHCEETGVQLNHMNAVALMIFNAATAKKGRK